MSVRLSFCICLALQEPQWDTEEGLCRRFGDELLEEGGQKAGRTRVGGRVTAGHTQDTLVDRRRPLDHGSRGWRKHGDEAGAGPGLRVMEVNE